MGGSAFVNFVGPDGDRHFFRVFPIDTSFLDIGAVFVLARTDRLSKYEPLYIGHTGNLGVGIQNSEPASLAKDKGANCVCVHPEDDHTTRRLIASELLRVYSPICNAA